MRLCKLPRPYVGILIVGLTISSGCGSDRSPDSWLAHTDTIADTVVVRTVAGRIWDQPVHLVEAVTIGALDGSDEYMFGEVFRMAEDREGGIYVFDRSGPVLRHYDRTGEFINTVGREGEGPGEYSWLSLGMVVDRNGILTFHDVGNQRLARFSPDDEPLDPWRFNSSFFTTTLGPGVFAYRDDQILVRIKSDDRPALVVVDSAVVKDTLWVPQPPGMPRLRGGPYRVDTYWDWCPAGQFVVGVSDAYSFEVHGASGVVRIERDVEPLPVHSDEAAAWRRYFRWMEARPNAHPPEGEWLPSTMPPFRGISAAAGGRIWVRRNVEPIPIEVQERPGGPPPVGWRQPFVYDVFEATGTYLGEVRLPNAFEPHIFGAHHIWGVRRGELDEEYVVRMEIRGDSRPDG